MHAHCKNNIGLCLSRVIDLLGEILRATLILINILLYKFLINHKIS